jgi:tetrapyrrole methylase family protein / MazG family protein
MTNDSIKNLEELYQTIKILRDPNGCPWDSKQTSKSLIPYLLEETHEVIEAIESDNVKDIKEELGDLFLHLIFQSQIYEEKNAFNLSDIFQQIDDKLKNRHPELFGIESDTIGLSWEEKKQKEKKRKRFLDGVPKSLPALTRASRIQEKAAQVGFDWDEIEPIWGKVNEEIEELKIAIQTKDESKIMDEMGDVLFSFVNLCRFLKVQPESSLKGTIIKFEKRFSFIEEELARKKMSLSEASLEEMDEIWNKSKKL